MKRTWKYSNVVTKDVSKTVSSSSTLILSNLAVNNRQPKETVITKIRCEFKITASADTVEYTSANVSVHYANSGSSGNAINSVPLKLKDDLYYIEAVEGDGDQQQWFSNSHAQTAFTESDSVKPSFYLYVRNSSSQTVTVTLSEQTIIVYFDGDKTFGFYNGAEWKECVPYILLENGWIQCLPYYYDGTKWVEISASQ